MAGIEYESYQTRTVDQDGYGEKRPIQEGSEEDYDPSMSSPHDGSLISGAAAQDLKYGMPAGYGARDEAHITPIPGGSVMPPIMPSEAEPDAPLSKQKRILDAYILGLGLGFFGAHNFYLRRYGFGAAYFFTFGFLGCGYLADLFRMPVLVRRYNQTRAKGKKDNKKHLDDAYVCWFPLGLFGAHHFYLGRNGWGVLYLFTVGLLGIGWLIDGFYLPFLVKKINKEQAMKQIVVTEEGKSLYIAWLFAIFPLSGILGVHHYYLGNYIFGLFYTLTVGNLGVGYLVDWFRTPAIVKRANEYNTAIGLQRKAYLDEAYLLAFPLGFLGLHNFYLRRYGWGVLYFFTIGCFGIGWLLDLIRMPCLVRDHNKMIEDSAISSLPTQGISNPVMFQDPVSEQEKALEGSRMEGAGAGAVSGAGDGAVGGAVGGVFATNLQPNYPYPPQTSFYGYTDQVPQIGYMPPTPFFNPNMVDPGMPYQPAGVVLPHYDDQDGLPSYNDAISTGTIDSSLVSSQGGPPSIGFPPEGPPPPKF